MNSRQFTELPQDVIPGIVSFNEVFVPGTKMANLSRGFRYEAEQNARPLRNLYPITPTGDSWSSPVKFQLQRAALDKNWNAMRVLLNDNHAPENVAFAITLARINGNSSLAREFYDFYHDVLEQDPEYGYLDLYYDGDYLIQDAEYRDDSTEIWGRIPRDQGSLWGWLTDEMRAYMLSNPYIFDRLNSADRAYVSGIIPPEMLEFYVSTYRDNIPDPDLYQLVRGKSDLYLLALAIAMPTLTSIEVNAFGATLTDDATILIEEQMPLNQAALLKIASILEPSDIAEMDEYEQEAINPIVRERLPHLFQ